MERNQPSDEPSETKFLGNKRVSSTLLENFVFRKALGGSSHGNYEKIASVYRNIFSFDWDDEKILKLKCSPLSFMTPSAFWFYISSQYFPLVSNEFFSNSEELRNMIDILLDKYSQGKILKKTTNPQSRRNFFYDIFSLIHPESVKEEFKNEGDEANGKVSSKFRLEINNSKRAISVDKMISDIEHILKDVQGINHDRFSDIVDEISSTKDFISTDNPEKDQLIDYDNIITDMQYYSDTIQQYHEYLIAKHNYNIKIKENSEVLTKFEDEQNKTVPDDVVCAVCNSGDYEDNDLIVFCSSCNIAVHQNCYGILVIPKDDWICDACLSFGHDGSKKLECILCPVKGGALKITTLKKKSTMVKFIHSLGKRNGRLLFETTRKEGNSSLNSICSHGLLPNIESSPLEECASPPFTQEMICNNSRMEEFE